MADQQQTATSAYYDDPVMYDVVGACYEVHRELKWVLYERAYKLALTHLLTKRGHKAVMEAPMDFFFQGDCISTGLRPELQTYMLLTRMPLVLLVNFHARNLRNGGLFSKNIREIRQYFNLPPE